VSCCATAADALAAAAAAAAAVLCRCSGAAWTLHRMPYKLLHHVLSYS
jgi:hypothetical protein